MKGRLLEDKLLVKKLYRFMNQLRVAFFTKMIERTKLAKADRHVERILLIKSFLSLKVNWSESQADKLNLQKSTELHGFHLLAKALSSLNTHRDNAVAKRVALENFAESFKLTQTRVLTSEAVGQL